MKNLPVIARGIAPALSALSLAMVAGAKAQSLEINPVVISAARVEQPLSQALTSVSVITRQDIDKSQAPSLAELLQGEAGFEFGRNGGPGTTTSFFLRGQDSINVVIMVDGVRSQVDSIGALQVLDVPLSQIERIEVLRGNASALYGDAAIGGVISITTRSGKGVPAAYGAVAYGSRQSSEVLAGHSGKSGDYRWDVHVGRKQTDGFSAINTAQKSAANPDRDAYEAEFWSVRLDRQLGADTSLGLRVQGSRSVAETDNAWAMSPRDTHQFKKDNQIAGLSWRQALTADWFSHLEVSTSELTYQDFENGQRLNSYGLFEGRQNGVRWFNTWNAGQDTTMNFGLDKSLDKFEVDQGAAYAMERDATGYFAGLTQKWSPLTLQVNVRHDDIKMSQQEPGGASRRNDASADTGLLGVGYALTPQWSLSASVSNGFRAPTASEISKNSELRPETHRSAEVGATYKTEQFLLRVVGFETETRDAIMYKPLGGWNYTYESVGRVQNQGIEATLRANWMGYAIKATAVSQDPWNAVTQKQLDRRAKSYGTLDVSRPVAGYDMGARVYVSGQRKDGDKSLAAYSLWSFYASRKIGSDWTARVRLENAFDKAYQLAYGYNTPGRGIFVSLQYQPR
jgi:vitamin B12 transporter